MLFFVGGGAGAVRGVFGGFMSGSVCLVGMTDIFRIFEFEQTFLHHPGNIMNTYRITRAAEHRGDFIRRYEIILANDKNRPTDEIRGCPFFSFEQGKHRLAECFITSAKSLM